MAGKYDDPRKTAFIESIGEALDRIRESLYDGDIELLDDGRYAYTTNIDTATQDAIVVVEARETR